MTTSWMAAALLSLAPAATAQADATPPDVTGVWVLNAEASDDAREKFQEAMRDRFRGRGGGGGPGGRPGGGPGGGGLPGGGGGGRGRGGGPDGEPPVDPEAVRAAYERLVIENRGEEIQISYGDELRIYRPDGREVERETERGRVKVKAHWDETRLVIESKGERMRHREVLELEADTGRLVLTQLIDDRMGQVKIRRVYDRGEAEATPPETEGAPPDSGGWHQPPQVERRAGDAPR